MPEDKPLSENWSAEARFAVVLETAGLSELEADARTTTVRQVLRNALSEVERQAIVALCNIPARHLHENPARRTGTNPWLRCQ